MAKAAAKTTVSGPSAAARAKIAIMKATGQKPIGPTKTTVPHLSTGSLSVNMLIGGTPGSDGKPICPGFPRRRITEVYGQESSGKTTLLLSAIVQAQKAGGCAMFIDYEHALDLNYAKAVGVDIENEDKWLFFQPEDMEQGLKMAYIGVATGVDIVGIDSIAAMVPKDELTKDLDDNAKIGAVARILARDLPKFVLWLQKYPMEGKGDARKKIEDHPGTAFVVLNQTRAVINTSGGRGGDTENTSGGKALKFFSYMRLRMQRIKSEFIERKDPMTGKKRRFPYGNLTDVKVIKSKVDAKQGHSTNVFIRYGYGIDDYLSLIEAGVTYKLIKRAGAFYSYEEHRFQGKDKFRQFLINDPKVMQEIHDKLVPEIGGSAYTAANDEDLTEEDLLLESMGEDMGVDLDEEVSEALSETEELVSE